MDKKRRKKGKKLINAAHEFWKACKEEGQYGAVQWLQTYDGALVVFTRGEYREQLFKNIESMNNVHRYGESLPEDTDGVHGRRS